MCDGLIDLGWLSIDNREQIEKPACLQDNIKTAMLVTPAPIRTLKLSSNRPGLFFLMGVNCGTPGLAVVGWAINAAYIQVDSIESRSPIVVV